MRINKFVAALSVAGTLLSVAAPVQAASSYKIVKHKVVKKFAHSKATYSYEEPVLKGNSKVVKKINKDLHNSYKKDWNSYKKDGYKVARTVSGWYYNDPEFSQSAANMLGLYTNTKVYKGKYLSVAYYQVVDNYMRASEYGLAATYSLKTGKKLKVTDLVKGNKATVIKKILKAQDSNSRSFLKYSKLNPSKLLKLPTSKKL